MKIIAHVGQESVLVEISRTDLSRLLGSYSESNLPSELKTIRGGTFEIGREFNISEVYSAVREVVWAGSTDSSSVSSIRKTLQKLDKNLETIENGIQPICKEAFSFKV